MQKYFIGLQKEQINCFNNSKRHLKNREIALPLSSLSFLWVCDMYIFIQGRCGLQMKMPLLLSLTTGPGGGGRQGRRGEDSGSNCSGVPYNTARVQEYYNYNHLVFLCCLINNIKKINVNLFLCLMQPTLLKHTKYISGKYLTTETEIENCVRKFFPSTVGC